MFANGYPAVRAHRVRYKKYEYREMVLRVRARCEVDRPEIPRDPGSAQAVFLAHKITRLPG